VTSVRCSPRCAPFSPRNQTVHQRTFRHPSSIPLCDLRDLCAMLFPEVRLSRPETKLSTKEPSAARPQSPLCDLCDLCAMLSPNARLSRPETKLSTKEPSAAQPQSPLCDLRDLCAMLFSPMAAILPTRLIPSSLLTPSSLFPHVTVKNSLPLQR
jgi:hypothetical protein